MSEEEEGSVLLILLCLLLPLRMILCHFTTLFSSITPSSFFFFPLFPYSLFHYSIVPLLHHSLPHYFHMQTSAFGGEIAEIMAEQQR